MLDCPSQHQIADAEPLSWTYSVFAKALELSHICTAAHCSNMAAVSQQNMWVADWIVLRRYAHCARTAAAGVLSSDSGCGMQHSVLKQHTIQLGGQLHNIDTVHPESTAAAQAPVCNHCWSCTALLCSVALCSTSSMTKHSWCCTKQ